MYVSREMQIKTMKYHNQNLEHWQHEMLAKKWNNRNSHTLLMGMKNDIAFLENSLAVSYKSKHTLNIQSCNYALRYLTKRVDYLCSCKNPHTDVSVSSVQFSCLVVSDSLWPHGQLWNSLGQNTGVSSCFLLQGIFPTQVSHIAGGFFTAEPPRKPKNTGVGSLSLLQWIFLTQESNRGLLHCRQILYRLSYQESLWRGNRDEIICPENRV